MTRSTPGGAGQVRAAVLLGRESMEVQSFPAPTMPEGGGLLSVLACGVCGADPHAYYHGLDLFEEPCVLGHEVVGRIRDLSPEAARRWGVARGQVVVVEEYLPCGTCTWCLRGVYHLCTVNARHGGKRITPEAALWGGYAEEMVLHPQSIVCPVPDESVPPALYTLYVPISNGLSWVGVDGGLHAGGSVVVVGPGAHGLGCVVGARELGARAVTVVGLARDRARLEVAEALGATTVVVEADEPAEDVAERVRDRLGGLADVAVNVASGAGGLGIAVACTAPCGTVVQAGVSEEPVLLDAKTITLRRMRVQGVLGRPSHLVPPALAIVASGRYPLEAVGTHVYGIEQAEEAIRASVSDPSVVKAIVVPQAPKEADPR